MKTKVLITGANGFIGSHLTAACLKAGFEVHAAIRSGSNLSLFQKMVAESPDLQIITLDYFDRESVSRHIAEEGYEYIIHNAGITKAKDESTYNKVNAEMTLALAKATLDSGVKVKRFIYLSSLAALGPLRHDGSGSRPHPLTAYGKSKLLAERYLQNLRGLPVTLIRPTAVYGPGEKDLLIVLRLLSQGFDLNIGSTPQKLTFVHVSDLVNSILLAMNEFHSPWMSFDISDGNDYNRYALSEAVKTATGKNAFRLHFPISLVRGLAWINESYASITGKYPALNEDKVHELAAENWHCNVAPAVKVLGYQPQHDLTSGVSQTIHWYQEQKWL